MTDGSKSYVFTFMRPYVRKSLKAFYNVEKLPMGDWLFQDPDEFTQLREQVSSGKWRYYTIGRGFV